MADQRPYLPNRRCRDTLPVVARLDRLREFVDRLHPSGLLYATYEHRLIAELDHTRLPRHVAVLADGNRRWARTNAPGQPLVAGYQAGADKLKEFVEWCDELGIPVVTLWVLSTDNFSRSSAEEIAPLLAVIEKMVTDLAATRRWRVHPVGALDLLPAESASGLEGGRSGHRRPRRHAGQHRRLLRRPARAARRRTLAARRARGQLAPRSRSWPQTLDIEHIAEHLYTKGQPDPDLIIRTSGEQRLSGFLMWQSAHSEFYFCEALWPDFRKVDFIRALRSVRAAGAPVRPVRPPPVKFAIVALPPDPVGDVPSSCGTATAARLGGDACTVNRRAAGCGSFDPATHPATT